MVKFFSAVTLFILLFTSYWMAELDRWPFIYRHPVPEKLNAKIQADFLNYLISRGVSEIKFGSNTTIQKEKISVTVIGDISEVQTIKNPKIGVVWLKADPKLKVLKIYWNVPQAMEYSEAVEIISDLLREIISNNDETRKVKNTFK